MTLRNEVRCPDCRLRQAILALALVVAGCASAYQPTLVLTPHQTQAEGEAAIAACREIARAYVHEHFKGPSAGEAIIAIPAAIAVAGVPPLAAVGPVVSLATTGAGVAAGTAVTATSQHKGTTLEEVRAMHRTAMDACLRERGYKVSTATAQPGPSHPGAPSANPASPAPAPHRAP